MGEKARVADKMQAQTPAERRIVGCRVAGSTRTGWCWMLWSRQFGSQGEHRVRFIIVAGIASTYRSAVAGDWPERGWNTRWAVSATPDNALA